MTAAEQTPKQIYSQDIAQLTSMHSQTRTFTRLRRRFTHTCHFTRLTTCHFRMGVFSDVKIPWNHFGKKHRLYFNRNEIDRADLFDVSVPLICMPTHKLGHCRKGNCVVSGMISLFGCRCPQGDHSSLFTEWRHLAVRACFCYN